MSKSTDHAFDSHATTLLLQSTALATVANAVVITDVKGTIQWVNPAFTALTGYALEEVVGQTPRLLKSGHHDAAFYRRFWDTLLSGQTWRGEFTNRRKDGTLYCAEHTVTPVRSENGAVTHFIAIMFDLTERQRNEEELRATHAQLRQLLEHSPAVIYALRLDGRMIVPYLASENITELLGFTVAEALAPDWWEAHLHPDDRSRAVASVDTTIAEGISRTEYRVRRKDGSYRWVEDNRRLVCDDANHPKEIVGIWTDITEAKEAEQALREADNRLLQAQKMEAIGQLAGGIAHDFNNILGCILGYTELALMESTNAGVVEGHLDHVIKATHRAKDLVSQILTFSRRHEQERKAIKLQQVLKEALKLLRASLPSTIEIVSNISGSDVPCVLGNATQMHQIVMNLATNAAHAMGGRAGQLQVNLGIADLDGPSARGNPDLRPGRYVTLTVADTGCGMDSETLQRIFEPFFTTKAPGEGTGLGLAVVHGIVKDHKGAIAVSSERGKGTTFQIYLPAHSEAAIHDIPRVAVIPRAHGEHVLFVDDEPPLAALGQRMLERAGYKVTVRTSAQEALNSFRDNPTQYDLVVTDLTMPHITGTDLTVELLRIRPETPVILTTGMTNMITPDKAKALGVRGLLAKPWTAQSLAEAAHAVLTHP